MAAVIFLFVTLCVLFVSCHEEKTEEMDDLFKVIGGDAANPGDIPYQVRLGKSPDLVLGCGGAIIDEYHFLTAAHCADVEGSPVMAGSIDLRATNDSNRFTTQLDKIFVHPNYNEGATVHDIAVARIKGKFTWTDSVKPVTMAEEVPQIDTYCEVSGWGWTHPIEKNRPFLLQKLQLPITDRKICEKAYQRDDRKIYPTMICAGFQEGGKDACQGDSGGPLTCNGSLVGIVSWGIGCAETDHYGVYTDVSAYPSWIRTTLEESYSEMGESISD